MAANSSFDVTTGVDFMEAHNAVDQATKEITQRYDFKGLKVGIELNQKDKKIVLSAPDEYKLQAIWDVLQSKMVRRQVRKNSHAHGIGRHSAAERLVLGKLAVDAVSNILGDNTYILGKKICGTDAAIYGFLLSLSCPIFKSEIREYTETKANLMAYLEDPNAFLNTYTVTQPAAYSVLVTYPLTSCATTLSLANCGLP